MSFYIIINRLWQDGMVTFNRDESFWSVQILVEALTTRQNADRLLEDNIAHQTVAVSFSFFLFSFFLQYKYYSYIHA